MRPKNVYNKGNKAQITPFSVLKLKSKRVIKGTMIQAEIKIMLSRDKDQKWKTDIHKKKPYIKQNDTCKVTKVNEQHGLHLNMRA